MDDLRLRFPQREAADLVLDQGVHAIAQDADGKPIPVGDPDAALVQFCVDRRGVWLQACDGGGSLHVNGRPVKRMAMLRAGDSIYLDGGELQLLGPEPLPAPHGDEGAAAGGKRMVLRGVGGIHHGRCFSLRHPVDVGRARDCAIRIDDPAVDLHHARLIPHAQGIVLRAVGAAASSIVNGHQVRDALLCPGDQIMFDPHDRFVVEAPMQASATHPAVVLGDEEDDEHARESAGSQFPASVRRVPWLLLAAVLLAGGIGLLLLYGTR